MTREIFYLDPKATTSADYHAERAEEREELGSYFGDRVTTVTPSPSKPSVTPVRPLKAPPSSLKYDRPYEHLTDSQKLAYNKGLRDNKPEIISLTDRQKKLTFGRGK